MSETIVAVDRALDVLLLMYHTEEEIGVSEIGRDLNLHKSTVHRILATLEAKGFVSQNKDNGKYWLGNKIYIMGLLVGEKTSLADVIRPYAKKLFDEFQEVVNVSILDKDLNDEYKSIVILKISDEKKLLSINPNIGSSSDAHVSSVGKCLLAFTQGVKFNEEKPLKTHTKNTIANYKDLSKELEKIRNNGYAIDNEEQEIGLYCIGAPILDKSGNAIAAISISGPTIRMKNDEINHKLSKLMEIANEISLVAKQIR